AKELADADLLAARDQVRAMIARARSNRFKLQHAIETVDNQVASLRANAATLATKRATLTRAQADFRRAEDLFRSKAISKAQFDQQEESIRVAEADVRQALESVIQIRAGLGLPPMPQKGDDLTEVPPELDQNFSSVRQALAELLESAAPLGILPRSYDASPKQ